MVESILHGIVCGIAGFLVAAVLTRRGEVLSWWPDVVQRIIGKDELNYNAIQYFIFKIAYGCSKCVAGQIALWTCLFHADVGHVATSVVVAVFSAFAIEKHYE